jgi:phosphate-selective porin OprO/OprP
VRPILSGAVAKYYEFQIMPDFGQGKVNLQDGWLNIAYFAQAQLQLGKYKAPVNMERLQSDPYLEFIQRSQVQNLVPNRDVGAEVQGILFDGRLSYQLALMNGVPNNTATSDFDNNDAKEFIGRVFLTPFKRSSNEWAKGFGVGLGGTSATNAATPPPSARRGARALGFRTIVALPRPDYARISIRKCITTGAIWD